jgi:hypothetical protein
MKIKGPILLFPVFILAMFARQPGFSQSAQAAKNGRGLKKRIVGDPLENLPKNIEVLTLFGERADISPDNKRVAFMAKTFGDAMVIDVKTKKISCLTCNIPAAVFVRVMHLSTGDYLLIGPEKFENSVVSKRNNDLWFLSKLLGSKPVKMGQKVSEGVAISKTSMKIAFTEMSSGGPQVFSKIVVADLDLSGEAPKLINRKTVLESSDKTCTVEAQDFYADDTKMTFFCYIPNGAFDVKGVDLVTRHVTNFSNMPNAFNEPEGIFPDGRYTTVEMDRQCEWLGGPRGSANIDIWKLKLDGTGKDLVRLTHFNDYEGGKAANPVVSTDGKFMAFQAAKSTDPPGMGHGIMLYWFNPTPKPPKGGLKNP